MSQRTLYAQTDMIIDRVPIKSGEAIATIDGHTITVTKKGITPGHIKARLHRRTVADTKPGAAKPKPEPSDPDAEPEGHEPPPPSKAAIELAEQHGIDLNSVVGSGANGQITKPDVERVIHQVTALPSNPN